MNNRQTVELNASSETQDTLSVYHYTADRRQPYNQEPAMIQTAQRDTGGETELWCQWRLLLAKDCLFNTVLTSCLCVHYYNLSGNKYILLVI